MYLTNNYNNIPNINIIKSNWNYSIDIILINLDFNMLDLFLIFKSYQLEHGVYINSIYLILSNKNQSSFFVYNKLSLSLILEGDFKSFEKYIQEKLFNDYEYIKNFENIGFRLVYWNIFKFINNNALLYPNYPWNNKLYDMYLLDKKYEKNKNINLIKENSELKKKIIELQEQIEIYKKK